MDGNADYEAFDGKAFDNKMKELLKYDSNSFYQDWEESFETFDQMGLNENLLRGIYAYGFEKPSAIQQKGIVPFIRGLDVIQQAQSGTGKTATFCTGVLQNLDCTNPNCPSSCTDTRISPTNSKGNA